MFLEIYLTVKFYNCVELLVEKFPDTPILGKSTVYDLVQRRFIFIFSYKNKLLFKEVIYLILFRYGKGYSLILNCKENTLDTVKQFIETALPGGKLAEEKLNHLLYQLPKETVQLDQVFQCIEVIRNDLKDFSVCQTTLEEVGN